MWYLILGIFSLVMIGIIVGASHNNEDDIPKAIVSCLVAIVLMYLSAFAFNKYANYCYNKAIVYYQNGNYTIIEKPNGELTYILTNHD